MRCQYWYGNHISCNNGKVDAPETSMEPWVSCILMTIVDCSYDGCSNITRYSCQSNSRSYSDGSDYSKYSSYCELLA